MKKLETGHKPEFWMGPAAGREQKPMHCAFLAEDRNCVDAFYQRAMDIGAQGNGEAGIREIYHPNYYGAFVLDPDGHNIEAVCHKEG